MPQFNFSTFTSRAQWQQALDTLVAAAEAACGPGGTADDRQAVRTELRNFRSLCPFDEMRSRALEALNDLSLADIGRAIGHLNQVQRQLQDDQTFLRASMEAQGPIQQARRALVTLTAANNQPNDITQAAQNLRAALDATDDR